AHHPVVLERRLVAKPWGGTALAGWLGVSVEGEEPLGETWEVYDRPDGSNALRGGGTLRDWLRQDMTGILGPGVVPGPGDTFPLLLKFIDANEALSVQVHPDHAQAAEQGDGPKNEAWVVLDARSDARVIRGFRDGVSREQVVEALDTPALEGLMRTVEPKKGDTLRIDAGCVHAMGPGVVVFEVQQNSDITYRMYDWGRGRELHLDDAVRAMTVEDDSPALVDPVRIDESSQWLVRSPFYSVRRFDFDQPSSLPVEGSFKVLTVVEGACMLGWRGEGADAVPVAKGESVVVPALCEDVFVSPIGAVCLFWTDAGGKS
ncbi:MAG: type I phosphomannose isomerase catalytic subunit, partial [Planctomycetota bacterium]